MSESTTNHDFQSANNSGNKWLKKSISDALPRSLVHEIQEQRIKERLDNCKQYNDDEYLPHLIYATTKEVGKICINPITKTDGGIFYAIGNEDGSGFFFESVGTVLLTCDFDELSSKQKELIVEQSYSLNEDYSEYIGSKKEKTFGAKYLTIMEDSYMVGRNLYPDTIVEKMKLRGIPIDMSSPIIIHNNSQEDATFYYGVWAHMIGSKLENIELQNVNGEKIG